CWGERHLWLRVVVDYVIDREVKRVLADAIVLNSHIKYRFQGTLAVADGVIGNALFLHTQGPFFCVGQLHAVDAGRPPACRPIKVSSTVRGFFSSHASRFPAAGCTWHKAGRPSFSCRWGRSRR